MRSSAAQVTLARRWFWVLLGMAVLAMSALYTSLTADAGRGTALVVLVSGLLLAGTTTQATRIWIALSRHRQQARRPFTSRFRRGPSPPR